MIGPETVYQHNGGLRIDLPNKGNGVSDYYAFIEFSAPFPSIVTARKGSVEQTCEFRKFERYEFWYTHDSKESQFFKSGTPEYEALETLKKLGMEESLTKN
jgi:hypothetical protein